jgi:predicted ester cyclase
MGIPATGRTVTITGITVTRFAEGKAVEEWEEINLLDLMRQLGAIRSAD